MKNQNGTEVDQTLIDAFHRAYYDSAVWARTTFLGVPVRKNPCDLWIYQEIIWETRPTLIIELGTDQGGSALWFAHCLTSIGDPAFVLSVDIEERERPTHHNIYYLIGDDTSSGMAEQIRNIALPQPERIMLVLDSDHAAPHVRRQLELYADLVTPGCYLVVEDTNLGHPVVVNPGGTYDGPMEALAAWLPSHPEFVVDREREKHGLTFFPNGFLRRAI